MNAIKFTLNKTAVLTLRIRNSAGTVIRNLTATRKAGSQSFIRDGKWSRDGKAHTGTYTYQLTAVDSAGYSATTSKLSTTIRNYQLVRTSSNTIRVISR